METQHTIQNYMKLCVIWEETGVGTPNKIQRHKIIEGTGWLAAFIMVKVLILAPPCKLNLAWFAKIKQHQQSLIDINMTQSDIPSFILWKWAKYLSLRILLNIISEVWQSVPTTLLKDGKDFSIVFDFRVSVISIS